MSRVRVYSGTFRPDRDTSVKPGLAMSIQDFGRLPLDAQSRVLEAGAKYGDPGVPDPSWNVPPVCRRGMTLVELERIYEESDARIREGIQRKMSHDAFEKRLHSLTRDNSVMTDNDGH